jgi:hypothetical protein
MTKAVMTVDFLAPREDHRPAMNPASVIWPEWPRESVARVFAMETAKGRRWRNDQPVTILNKDWKGTE